MFNLPQSHGRNRRSSDDSRRVTAGVAGRRLPLHNWRCSPIRGDREVGMSAGRRMRLPFIVLFTTSLGFAAAPAVSESESGLRQRLAWQVALDRVGFSPGL